MEIDVTIDRDKYIGGSDISVIMGISTFKTRWDLLLEKAGLKENEFKGNKFTEYGHVMEPEIRDYINRLYDTNFEQNQIINGDFRGNTDGFNGKCVLEIKTTSHIYDKVDDYIVYLVQLVKYMEVNNVEDGLLAVYERPEDFSLEFDENRLVVYPIKADAYKDLLEKVNAEIDRFLADLARLKDNPLLSEEDFQPNEIVTLTNKVMVLERRMAEYKTIQEEYEAMKQNLFEAMVKHDVKSWETFNGTKITRVDAVAGSTKTVTEFDADTFGKEHPKLYKQYSKEVTKTSKGRSGYVKITLVKCV
jgi:putative phage-type endonuclease